MAVHAGLDCRTYRNTGTWASPTWNEITLAKDVSLDISKSKASAKSRLSAYSFNWHGMVDAPITLNIIADPAVDDYDVLKDAAVSRTTVLDVALANGAIATTGTRYFRAEYGVFGWKQGQPLEDLETIDVELDLLYPSVLTQLPAYTTVA